jgi:hypothetical protein
VQSGTGAGFSRFVTALYDDLNYVLADALQRLGTIREVSAVLAQMWERRAVLAQIGEGRAQSWRRCGRQAQSWRGCDAESSTCTALSAVEQIELAMDDPSWSSKNAKETAETTRFFENQKGTAKAYLPCGPPSAPTSRRPRQPCAELWAPVRLATQPWRSPAER